MSNCCTPVDTGQENKDTHVANCCPPAVVSTGAKSTRTQPAHCPACGQKGKKVDSLTLKSMLDVSLLALDDVPYLFCRTTECKVVYFGADGEQSFTKNQTRVPIHQKETADETVPVCYCFRHSPASIRAELLATGHSTVIEEINGGIKAGQCACEIRNPQGSCCLGNVMAVVKQVSQTLAVPASVGISEPIDECI